MGAAKQYVLRVSDNNPFVPTIPANLLDFAFFWLTCLDHELLVDHTKQICSAVVEPLINIPMCRTSDDLPASVVLLLR